MADVFISYEHGSNPIADNMVSVLESRRIRCWYAPRDVIGDHTTSIVEDLQTMAQRHPDDASVKEDLNWYHDVFDDLEEAFCGDDFFFQVGFMTFSATR